MVEVEAVVVGCFVAQQRLDRDEADGVPGSDHSLGYPRRRRGTCPFFSIVPRPRPFSI
jgi:hypothetical protein